MSDEALRHLLTNAVAQLRAATDLTMDEVIGIRALPESMRTPDVSYALGVIHGAAAALRATPREMLEDLDLLTAPKRT
jgi:uncharacterized protein YjgD (DUF1641 family)